MAVLSDTSSIASARWYDAAKGDAHGPLATVFRTVHQECSWRLDADEFHAGLYCNSDRPGVRGIAHQGYEYGPTGIPYNVCRAAVDTLQSKIAQHRPMPQVLTRRGSWKNQKRARKQTQFLEGEFYRHKIFEVHAKQQIRDALVFGRGALKIEQRRDKVAIERTHVWELYADEWDAHYSDPRNLYHLRSIDRGVALARWGKNDKGNINRKIADAIKTAGRFETYDLIDRAMSTVDRVDVLEAWHLPSEEGADDGRHVVIVQGATLIDEPYTEDHFPFVFLNFSDPLNGFWGRGLVEQLEGYQTSINEASEKLDEQYRMSGKLVMAPLGSGVNEQDIRNGITTVFHKPGLVPQVFDMDLVNEHLRVRPRELTQDALNDAGLSQMSVQSQKPAGITAGIALQTLDDIETERFMVFGRAYMDWCVEVAKRLVACAKNIAEEYGDYAVGVPMKGGILSLSWKDVYVEDFEIRISNASMIKDSLGARLEQLKDLWNSGQINVWSFLYQLSNPDLQAEIDIQLSMRLIVDEKIERMLDAEEGDPTAYIPPTAYDDLDWAAQRAVQRLDRAWLDGADEFNLKLVRQFLTHVEFLQAKKKSAAAVAPQPGSVQNAGNGAAGPIGGPGAPPPQPATPPAPDMAALGIPGNQPPAAA